MSASVSVASSSPSLSQTKQLVACAAVMAARASRNDMSALTDTNEEDMAVATWEQASKAARVKAMRWRFLKPF